MLPALFLKPQANKQLSDSRRSGSATAAGLPGAWNCSGSVRSARTGGYRHARRILLRSRRGVVLCFVSASCQHCRKSRCRHQGGEPGRGRILHTHTIAFLTRSPGHCLRENNAALPHLTGSDNEHLRNVRRPSFDILRISSFSLADVRRFLPHQFSRVPVACLLLKLATRGHLGIGLGTPRRFALFCALISLCCILWLLGDLRKALSSTLTARSYIC